VSAPASVGRALCALERALGWKAPREGTLQERLQCAGDSAGLGLLICGEPQATKIRRALADLRATIKARDAKAKGGAR
jgi:hypothetical protein